MVIFYNVYTSGKTKDLFEISSDSSDGEEMNTIVEKLVSNKSSSTSTTILQQQQQQHLTTEVIKPVKSNKKRTHNSKKLFPSPTNMSTPVGKHLQQQQQQNETPANRSFSSTPVQRSIRRYGKIKKSVNPFSPARKQVSIVFEYIYLSIYFRMFNLY